MSRRDVRYKQAAKKAPDFADEFLVECPKCQGCAVVLPMGEHDEEPDEDQPHAPDTTLNPRYLECSKCRFRRTWEPGDLSFLRTLVNWFGELSLFLRMSCGEQTVWAINEAHLAFLQEQLQQISDGATEASPILGEWLEDVDADELAACFAEMRSRIPQIAGQGA